MLGVGVEQFLQFADALAELGGFDTRGFLVQPVAVTGIEIFETDGRLDFDGLFHAAQIEPRTGADEHGFLCG